MKDRARLALALALVGGVMRRTLLIAAFALVVSAIVGMIVAFQ